MQKVTDTNSTITEWVDLYSDKMYSWAFYNTGSKETSNDLVQETFFAAIQSYEKFEWKSNPKTWLFAILKNKINDYHRGNFRVTTIIDSSIFENYFDENKDWQKDQRPKAWREEEGNILDNAEFQQTLQNCLQKLPGNWYSAIHLKFIDEKKREAICQELGISPTNFWQILHRAKLQLRKCLELNWFKK
jgi:RNA polymerase sigma-70 factor (TIGR02943 family)